jgi:hypothetical protein
LTNADRRRRGHTRGAWSSKYGVGCGGQPRVAPTLSAISMRRS